MGPVVAKLAGKYGDHLITIGDPNAIKNAVIPNFEKSAKEAGKDPSKMERAIALTYSIDPDYDKALEGLRKFSGSLVPAMFKYKVCSPLEIENNGKLVGKEILETSYIIATEPEQLIKRIESFVDAGITSFAFGNVSPNLDNGVDAFKEIIPYFKE
jgi:alkanesulfonate monooxygenase SsuD/methylene tetrahydromethanopterin reductase-like flavin-dependent oxidoreductase (luciferase family)